MSIQSSSASVATDCADKIKVIQSPIVGGTGPYPGFTKGGLHIQARKACWRKIN